jgi:hypothetical protein
LLSFLYPCPFLAGKSIKRLNHTFFREDGNALKQPMCLFANPQNGVVFLFHAYVIYNSMQFVKRAKNGLIMTMLDYVCYAFWTLLSSSL